MNTGILEKIIRKKTERLGELKKNRPLDVIAAELKRQKNSSRDFKKTVAGGAGISIIGEIKKCSPSAGLIRPDFDPEAVIRDYEGSAVAAISVLTEEDYFCGSSDYLSSARTISSKPLLEKDFFIDEYQVYESKLKGADCILLIAKLMDAEKLERFISLGAELDLDCLVETHSADDVNKAIDAGADMIGINNRDLETFRVDLRTTEKLIKLIPRGTVKVSESGIRTKDDIRRLESIGTDAVLIGELFMRAENIKLKVEELLSE